jgi:glycosyltransferase involved in cell wall biosynthesis
MNVWIFQTGEPLPMDVNARPMRAINLSNKLTSLGHNVVLWSSSFYHQEKIHRCNSYKKIQISNNLEVRLIPSPGYTKNVGFSRLFDHMILAKNLKKLLKKEDKNPDIAFVGFPPIESASVMVHWLTKRGVPCLLDVKDQWPPFMIDALPIGVKNIGRIILSPYFYLAKRAMNEATGLTAMADDFLLWALDFSNRKKGCNDFVAPLTTINNRSSDNDLSDAIQWWSDKGIADNKKVKVMFVGSHYPSLDFDPIFTAAALFIEKDIECDFIICGHGELTKDLVSRAKQYKNIFFPGWVDRPKIEVLSKMSIASIAPFRNIDCYMKSLPNKIIDSLSFGLPIISPLNGEVKRMIDIEKVGLTYREGSGYSLYENIIKLKLDKELRHEISKNSINLYQKKFSYEIVYGGLVDHLQGIVGIKND